MTSLFQSLQLGALSLPNRILMAPMTRGFVISEPAPTEMMIDYYAQRASAGLIISEAIGINKPNPKLYQRALARMELEPAEVMYVGDSPAHDVAPSNEIGMVSVWARRASKWRGTTSHTDADHTIDSFDELRTVVAARQAR